MEINLVGYVALKLEPNMPYWTIISSEFIKIKKYDESEDYARAHGFAEIGNINPKNSTVLIEIQNKPTLRVIRNVSFTRLDFVVCIGGIVGLFCGASILGLVEIVYIWMIRKFWVIFQ